MRVCLAVGSREGFCLCAHVYVCQCMRVRALVCYLLHCAWTFACLHLAHGGQVRIGNSCHTSCLFLIWPSVVVPFLGTMVICTPANPHFVPWSTAGLSPEKARKQTAYWKKAKKAKIALQNRECVYVWVYVRVCVYSSASKRVFLSMLVRAILDYSRWIGSRSARWVPK